ncbi:MAG: hypothetical protein GXP54_00080 [Deltaproteobacteria bacterium]|nr:hypothetical protein [Deltaproteobacteria bacterium]
MYLDDNVVSLTIDALVKAHPKVEARIRRGVQQVAMFWREKDGTADEFAAFCQKQFMADPGELSQTLDRFDRAMEAIGGHQVAMTRTLREPIDLDMGKNLPVDLPLASLNPFDHLSEDFFATKVAFAALLNFPLLKADEIEAMKKQPTREQWAGIRLAQTFDMRVPGDVTRKRTRVEMEANHYIDGYNIFLSGLTTSSGEHPFPGGPKLISHWGLRDHLKAMYAEPGANLDRQRLIQQVMYRIIRQEIPAAVIDNPELDWDPVTNVVSPKDGSPAPELQTREPDARYRQILDIFHVEQEVDGFSPQYPTYIERRFDREREMSEKTVATLLKAILDDPVAGDVAGLIKRRLGRDLEPFDIWYDGFKARESFTEAELNKKVRARYPDLAAFEKDLPGVLGRLGFDSDTAAFLSERIEVDPASGAGHAMGAAMRTDKAHLRTRVPRGGMDYKGYNIALHELGHTVEQTFSLYRVDRVLMQGVPNTAFTEAMAFLFQRRDLDVLGLGGHDPAALAEWKLDIYWSAREIAGVALVDMAMWRWMYDHPDATPAALREAVVKIATDTWNRYYAPYFGVKDSPLLAVYSHMIAYALYLPDYPIGYLIQFQMEKQMKGKSLAKEMERMCVQGRLTPGFWMQGAVGGPLSATPLLDAARDAVAYLNDGC